MDRRINFIQLIQFQRNINISILFPCVGYCQLFVNSFNDCDINFLFRSNSAINVCWTACAGADDSTIYLISIIQRDNNPIKSEELVAAGSFSMWMEWKNTKNSPREREKNGQGKKKRRGLWLGCLFRFKFVSLCGSGARQPAPPGGQCQPIQRRTPVCQPRSQFQMSTFDCFT